MPSSHRFLSRCRSLAVSAALLLTSIILSLLVLEAAVRWLLPQYSAAGDIAYTDVDGVPLAPANTEAVQWKNTGDYRVSVSINRWGLRDTKDLATAKPTDVFVVGDSFSLGHGVEEKERYSNKVEELLGERVFNVAIPTDIAGYEALIGYAERNGAPVKRLILGICMENDIGKYRDRVTPVSSLRDRSSITESLRRAKLWLQRNSTAYRAVAHQAHESRQLEALLVRFGFIVPNTEGALRNVYSPAAIEQSGERVAGIAAGRQTLVVIIPSRLTWVGNNTEQERKLHAAFVEHLRSGGLQVIDMAPAFEREGKPMSYHFHNDGHWNASGHALAAAEIAAHLKAHGWPAITDASRLQAPPTPSTAASN